MHCIAWRTHRKQTDRKTDRQTDRQTKWLQKNNLANISTAPRTGPYRPRMGPTSSYHPHTGFSPCATACTHPVKRLEYAQDFRRVSPGLAGSRRPLTGHQRVHRSMDFYILLLARPWMKKKLRLHNQIEEKIWRWNENIKPGQTNVFVQYIWGE